MQKAILTEVQMKELETLKKSEYVKLARKEQRLKYKQRQQLYLLRNLEKRGKQLAQDGFTVENLDERIAEVELSCRSLESETD